MSEWYVSEEQRLTHESTKYIKRMAVTRGHALRRQMMRIANYFEKGLEFKNYVKVGHKQLRFLSLFILTEFILAMLIQDMV